MRDARHSMPTELCAVCDNERVSTAALRNDEIIILPPKVEAMAVR